MADTLSALTEQLKTTEEVGDIVRTMKSLSAVSIHQYETAVDALEAYQQTVDLGLQILLRDRPRGRVQEERDMAGALVVFGSDRGLCGPFNRLIAAAARDVMHERRAAPPTLLIIGARIEARLSTAGFKAEKLFRSPASARAIERTAQAILVHLESLYDQGIGAIDIVTARRGRRTRVTVDVRRLAPVPADELHTLAAAPWRSRRLPIVTMPPEALLSWLLRERVFIGLQRAAAEALAAEHAMRLAAMQAAERNIEERLDEVRQAVRRVRQDEITGELLDIVTGYEASRAGRV